MKLYDPMGETGTDDDDDDVLMYVCVRLKSVFFFKSCEYGQRQSKPTKTRNSEREM